MIGASAGGLEALITLFGQLPASLAAPVCVVLHTSPYGSGKLATVLGRQSALPVDFAHDRQPLRDGCIYVAPPDQHLVLDDGMLRLTRGPRENRQRPAVDALFRSAAYTHGTGAIGVVLSGALDDGTAGLWTIKDRGGIAIAQDPAEALFAWMPQSAIEYVQVDHVVTVAAMAPLLDRLVRQPTSRTGARPVSKELEIVNEIARGDAALDRGVLELGPQTPYTCPDCAGVLMQVKEGGVPAFRCHTGHAYSFDTLMAAASEHTETLLYNALRGVEEMIMLLDQAATHARDRRDHETADAADVQRADAEARADMLRRVVAQHQALAHERLRVTPPRPAARPSA